MTRTRAVRADDALDVATLAEWVHEHVGATGEPSLSQFSGGSSNLTYLLTLGDTELVVRRPPAGERSGTAHDMTREYEFQRRLKPHFPPVPQVFALCEDDAVIGSPFYVMERVDGVAPGPRMPPEIGTDPRTLAQLAEQFVELWVALHAIDVEQAGLADLGRGPGYVERQVRQWSERYRRARTSNVPDFEQVMGWLEEHRPPDRGTCVIHNDFRLDNMVMAPRAPHEVRGVLDWEMATIGDPLMDLASSLTYWIERGDGLVARRFRRQPTDLRGFPTRRELAARYCELAGRDMDDWPFYEVFGLFRLAVIAQQIYRRYRDGRTTNPAFRFFWVGVRKAHRECRRRMR
jgi:aminoglycoside phosphotransferase (APT) family kinase protein